MKELVSFENVAFVHRKSIRNWQVGAVRWTDLTFTIRTQSCIVLVGPSGIGKTTLLKLIAGLYKNNEGNIIHHDIGLTQLTVLDRNVGLCLQRGEGLQPHATVRNNILFPLLNSRHSSISPHDKDSLHRRLNELANKFWLYNVYYDPIISGQEVSNKNSLLNQEVMTLSGGQRQRVALARCFAIQERRLYLLDEPFDGQDNPLRQKLINEVRLEIENSKYNGTDSAFLIVTHRQSEALSLADTIIFLGEKQEGEYGIIHIDNPQNIYDKPASLYIANFFGTSLINIIDCNNENGILTSGSLRLATLMANYSLEPSSFIVAIRPEDICISLTPNPLCQTEMQGKIEKKSYEGEIITYEVRVPSLAPNLLRVRSSSMNETYEFNTGDSVFLGWRRDRLHFFDKDSEQRIEVATTE